MFLILAALYLITRLPILTYVPFMQDEAFYSVMIEEQIAHPTTVVTLFDYPVGWKPPLFFWISGFFVQFLRGLPIPIEAVYRLPNILFGLINVFLVYFIFEKVTGEKNESFVMALVYITMGVPIHTELRVLTDTMCGTFIFAGVLSYIKGLEDSRWFLFGGIFTFLAYFVKQSNAAVVPIVAVALILQTDRKKLLNPLLIISLFAFPVATALEDISFNAPLGDMTTHFAKTTLLDKLKPESLGGSILGLFPLTTIWLVISVFGFWKNWNGKVGMSAWYCLIIFPLIAGVLMPFYFYPVIPAIAYFAVKFLSKDGQKTKMDQFFYIVFFICVIVGYVIGTANHIEYKKYYLPQKNIGEFLVGKENVLIIGEYQPAVIAYKMLEEKRATGRWLDCGLIVFPKTSNNDTYYQLIQNYSIGRSDVVDGNFGGLFEHNLTYRKSTNITKFEYIVITGNKTDINPGGTLVLQDFNIKVYHVDN